MFDPNEFLSEFGIRSHQPASHRDHPYELRLGDQASDRVLRAGGIQLRDVRRQLQLAWADLDANESAAGHGLRNLHRSTATNSLSSTRPGPVRHLTRIEIADDLAHRLTIFLPDDGRRPCFGGSRCCKTIRTGGIICSSTSTSTATMAQASGQAIKPDGPARRPHLASVRDEHVRAVRELGNKAGLTEVHAKEERAADRSSGAVR